jgi:hypothetical protein
MIVRIKKLMTIMIIKIINVNNGIIIKIYYDADDNDKNNDEKQ